MNIKYKKERKVSVAEVLNHPLFVGAIDHTLWNMGKHINALQFQAPDQMWIRGLFLGDDLNYFQEWIENNYSYPYEDLDITKVSLRSDEERLSEMPVDLTNVSDSLCLWLTSDLIQSFLWHLRGIQPLFFQISSSLYHFTQEKVSLKSLRKHSSQNCSQICSDNFKVEVLPFLRLGYFPITKKGYNAKTIAYDTFEKLEVALEHKRTWVREQIEERFEYLSSIWRTCGERTPFLLWDSQLPFEYKEVPVWTKRVLHK